MISISPLHSLAQKRTYMLIEQLPGPTHFLDSTGNGDSGIEDDT